MGKDRNHAGFTMIELLIVMVLISILAIVGIPTFQGTQRKSRDGKRKADLAQVAKAIEMYANDMGRYPCATTGSGSDAGVMTDCSNAAYTWGKEFKHGSTVYMQKLPTDPLGTQQRYYYESVGTVGKGYRLWAYLENEDDPDVVMSATAPNCLGAKSTCNYMVKSPNLIQ